MFVLLFSTSKKYVHYQYLHFDIFTYSSIYLFLFSYSMFNANSLNCLIIFVPGCQRCKGNGKAFEWERAVYVGKSCSLYCFLYLPSQISSQIVARNIMYSIRVVYRKLRLHNLFSYEEECGKELSWYVLLINSSVKLIYVIMCYNIHYYIDFICK